jgi:hypothetical protein
MPGGKVDALELLEPLLDRVDDLARVAPRVLLEDDGRRGVPSRFE